LADIRMFANAEAIISIVILSCHRQMLIFTGKNGTETYIWWCKLMNYFGDLFYAFSIITWCLASVDHYHFTIRIVRNSLVQLFTRSYLLIFWRSSVFSLIRTLKVFDMLIVSGETNNDEKLHVTVDQRQKQKTIINKQRIDGQFLIILIL